MLAFSFSWLYFLSVSYSFYRLFQSVSLLSPKFWDWVPTWGPSLTHALYTHVSVNMSMDTRAQRANYTRSQLKPLITCVHINTQVPLGNHESALLCCLLKLTSLLYAPLQCISLTSLEAHTLYFLIHVSPELVKMLEARLGRFPLLWQNAWGCSTHRRESLFGLRLQKFSSVAGCLQLLLGLLRQEIMVEGHREENVPHVGQKAKREEAGRKKLGTTQASVTYFLWGFTVKSPTPTKAC